MDESVMEKSFTKLLHTHERYEIREEGDDARAVKLLYKKLNVPDKTNWTIHFSKTTEGSWNVKLSLGNIEDSRSVLMCMLRQVYRDIKEFTTSFMLIVSGTANSKSIDSKKSKQESWPRTRDLATDRRLSALPM